MLLILFRAILNKYLNSYLKNRAATLNNTLSLGNYKNTICLTLKKSPFNPNLFLVIQNSLKRKGLYLLLDKAPRLIFYFSSTYDPV